MLQLVNTNNPLRISIGATQSIEYPPKPTKRGLIPTTAALKIVDAARDMASAAEKIQLSMRGLEENQQGSVRIACSQVVGSYLMPACVKELRKHHPGIQIDLVVANETSNLLRREADIALRMTRPIQSSLLAKHLTDIAIGIFAATSYLERCGNPNSIGELLKHDLLGQDKDEALIQGLQAAGIARTRDDFAVRTDDQVAYIRLLQEGCGIGFIAHYVADQLNSPAVLTKLPAPTLPIWLVAHREIKGNPLIRTVYDSLSESVIKALTSSVG